MFINEKFSEKKIWNSDLFVTFLGSEERSFFLYEKIAERMDSNKILIYINEDFRDCNHTNYQKIQQIKSAGVHCEIVGYADGAKFQSVVVNRIKSLIEVTKSIQIDFDYSSMPSEWYCKLPELLSTVVRTTDKITFWYVEGEYEDELDTYKTAGIMSYRVYDGKPSFETKRLRTHLIGVGYDAIRTQGILSILDPDCFVICEAYDPNRKEIHDNVVKVNSSILEQTSLHVSLFLTDIEFMITKLVGIINEFYYSVNSDVVLVPDGPKPLIFVMSMMPWIVGKEGVSCLHILGNQFEEGKRQIKAQGTVIGFSLIKKNENRDIRD